MTMQPINGINILPGPSSQTTTTWPLVFREKDSQLVGEYVGHSVNGAIIQVVKNRDNLIDDTFNEYIDAWEKLAEL